MIETITIKTRDELRVAKQSKRTYFTVTDENDRKFLCFNQSAFNEMPVGAGVAVEITERGDQTPTIDLIKEGTEKSTLPPLSQEALTAKPDKFAQGQTEGMCWKEIGELIRTGTIVNVFGKENAKEITKQYRAYLVEHTKLIIDRTKLPQWKDKT